MRTLARTIAAAVLIAALLAVSGSLANAAKSYNGADYSEDFNDTYIRTCDEESDKTKVKSVVSRSKNGSAIDAARDTAGNNGVCGSANMGWSIYRHRTCEYRSLWPDACGNWKAV